MAGIGFELKKLFSRRGLFASFRAYGYAGIICTGPIMARWKKLVLWQKTPVHNTR